jgi:hypothetical protein
MNCRMSRSTSRRAANYRDWTVIVSVRLTAHPASFAAHPEGKSRSKGHFPSVGKRTALLSNCRIWFDSGNHSNPNVPGCKRLFRSNGANVEPRRPGASCNVAPAHCSEPHTHDSARPTEDRQSEYNLRNISSSLRAPAPCRRGFHASKSCTPRRTPSRARSHPREYFRISDFGLSLTA